MKWQLRLLAAAAAVLAFTTSARAEVSELKITKQPGLIYLPEIIMEHDHLIEKHARQLGLGNLKVSWVTFTSGGVATSAMLAGQVHIVCTGTTNQVLLWDKTNGKVKGLASTTVMPLWLMTRNAHVHSVKDFTDKDRIAVPTVKVSIQAVLLQMAAAKAFGMANAHKLDDITVALGHPDAVAAISNPHGDIDSHFSNPPYEQIEARIPGVHRVLDSYAIFGGPHSSTTFFATSQFHDANPKTVKAFLAALAEADAAIKKDPATAIRKYLEVTHESFKPKQLTAIISSPGYAFTVAPRGMAKMAQFMHDVHLIKRRPATWQEMFFPEVHALKGGS
jgi:NitT/TauT family transport system substrate-binding protein